MQKRHGPIPDNPDRFWAKVDKLGPDDCWHWLGTMHEHGYGLKRWNGRQFRSHRIAYILTFGKIPDGLIVMHKCDNKRCCNPNHLEAGTLSQNTKDAYARGLMKAHPGKFEKIRPQKGELNNAAKLTEKDVSYIRANRGLSGVHLASVFNVSTSTISEIRTGKKWPHVI